MSYSEHPIDFVNEIIRRATAFVGQEVTLRLTNGNDIVGTLTGFSGQAVVWPAGMAAPSRALVVEAADDVTWIVRPDAVLAIAG